MQRFRDRDDFDATILAAAEKIRLPPVAVEKDYWVTEALRRLAADFSSEFVFKGGTSLTKALHVTNRFSEDIDILIVKGDKSWGACDRLMKEMGTCVQDAFAGDLELRNAETGRHRTYVVSYPANHEATGIIRPEVELEMGVRGGSNPSSETAITSFLRDELVEAGFDTEPYSDLAPLSVPVLHPGRTLVEKLFNVHSVATRLERGDLQRPPARTERHFFDVHELLDVSEVRMLLIDRGEFERIVEEVSEISREFFLRPGETQIDRPKGGFADSPAFNSSGEIEKSLREAYESRMPSIYYGPRLPSWEEIKERVLQNAELL